MLFHVNPETGEAGQCSAQKGKCPFGAFDEHFTSAEAARADYEKRMESATIVAQKKDGRSVRGNWPDLELYRDRFDKNSEIFVHPQGKIAFTTGPNWARLNVMKAGKKATTGGNLDDLRAGRGGWKQVKQMNEPAPSKEEYEKDYSANPTITVAGKAVPLAATMSAREAANLKAGYPQTSPFDPEKTVDLGRVRETESSYNYYGKHSRDSYSILPIDERGNPFKLAKSKAGEGMKFWNGRDRSTGEETVDTVIEVWDDMSGRGIYKAVATAGGGNGIGSTSFFHHDQTGRSMGTRWKLIGAFEPIENGGIVGHVPNVSMPIYTYK